MTSANDSAEQLSPLKRAIIELRDLRARLNDTERRQSEPIAIVGAGMRLPGGVRDEVSLWRLLAGGVDAVDRVPADRWDADAYFDADPDKPGKMHTKAGAFLSGVDLFDAEFFGISPREAVSMDPQHRLLLETAWEALENGALAPASLAGSKTGVFIGYGNSDYWRRVYGDELAIDAYAALGNALSVAAGRLSYFLGLQGPSLTVDTACSASLFAVHLACQSLRAGECSLALAAGVNLILSPELSINFSKSRMLAPDGRCKTFDAAADGYGRGEGCGVVVLAPLSAALAAGHRILAVIRGSAINQDGRSGGLTAPNGPAQEAVIREALRTAGVAATDVSYLEAHGTGTSLGDPIEVRAAGAVLCAGRPPECPLQLGSIKTNIGHLEGAAGIAGLLKVVTSLRQRQIPPHLHLKERNPFISWDQLSVTIPTTLTPWVPINGRRIAGLSSFGFSGSNAHLIIEEAPAQAAGATATSRPSHVLAISARSDTALRERATDLAAYLESTPGADLADVCFSANAGRSHFAHRASFLSQTTAQAAAALRAFASGAEDPGCIAGHAADPKPPQIAFLFTGQGSQYLDMGRALYETSPRFRATLDRCDEILRPILPRPLLSVVFSTDKEDGAIDNTLYTQPALFAIEVALADLWRSWGVHPSFVLGHSVGEYAAATVAGACSLEDGLRLIAERARLMQALPPGGRMTSVFAAAARVAEELTGFPGVAIAALNGPESTVISGEGQQVEQVVARLKAAGIKARDLVVSHAFHSPLMEPMLPDFERVAASIRFSDPEVGFVSNVTGKIADVRTIGQASYWRHHVRDAVQFAEGMNTLASQGVTVFLEIGPNPVLVGMAERCLKAGNFQWLPSLRAKRPDWTQLLESLQALYAAGVEIDWTGFDREATRQRLALPTYPFERRSYWFARPTPAATRGHDRHAIWQAARAAGARQARHAPLGINPAAYGARWELLSRLTTAHAAATFRELGAFARAGESHDVDSLVLAHRLPAMYRHLLQRWLERLAANGKLRADGPRFTAVEPLRDPGLDSCILETETALADDPDLLAYLRHCGRKLTGVIAGRESPLETLFPDGSSALAERLYEGANMNRYVNSIAGSVVEAVSRAWREQRPLRILEVGAGTGGTSSTLLPLLDPERSVYVYTDVSDLFLTRARSKFAAYPFVRFAVVDLEKTLESQGLEPNSFDIIVGANVVHAARDLDGALKRIQSLLTPGGFLLLVEATRHHDWFDFTTGLIEGWQHFADDLRGDNPLLPPQVWQRALTERGFAEAMWFPEEGSPAEVMGQHVIIARTKPTEGAEPAVNPALFSPVETAVDSALTAPGTVSADEIQALRDRIRGAIADEQLELMLEYVRDRVMRVLRLEAGRKPDHRHRLMDLGLDSLMAVQLRNVLETGLGLSRTLPATIMFDYPTIEAIASFLLKHVVEPAGPEVAPAPVSAPNSDRAREIEALSDDEAAALLLKRLERK